MNQSSWKVPEAFIWNAINSTCLSKKNNSSNYGRRPVGQLILVSSSHLEPMTNFCFLFDSCWFLAVGHRLWRGWVCNLPIQLLLALWEQTLRSKSQRTRSNFTVPFETPPPPNLEGQVPVFISNQEQGVPLGSIFVTSYGSLGYGGGIVTGRPFVQGQAIVRPVDQFVLLSDLL
jgi:hypothetical protein